VGGTAWHPTAAMAEVLLDDGHAEDDDGSCEPDDAPTLRALFPVDAVSDATAGRRAAIAAVAMHVAGAVIFLLVLVGYSFC